MKIHATLLALFLASLAKAQAPLTATTAIQTQADPSAPIVSYLKAGTVPTPSTDPTAVAPAGWMAVDVPGPFTGYVSTKDFTKGLDIKPGSSIYLAPKAGAGVLTTFAKGDKTEITGLFGDWTQVRLDRKIVGYIPVAGGPAGMTDVASTAPAPAAAPPAPPAPSAEAPAPAPAAPEAVNSNLPAVFQGTFAPVHKLIGHKPYAWELDDGSGSRIAYLDVSNLMFTDQVDDYSGKPISVFGTIRPIPGTQDLVIAVESLHLQ